MPTVDPRRLILVVSTFALVSCSGGASSTSPSAAASPIGSTATASTALPTASPSATAEPLVSPSPAAGASGPPSSSPVAVVKAAPPKPAHTTYTLVKETEIAAKTQITE